jgi:group I intron endonuclease
LNYSNDYIIKNEIGSRSFGFIYITVNLIDGKKYIGQKKFYSGWRTYLGSGKYLKNAIKKYGRENFAREIIAIAYSAEELNELERHYIELYNCVNCDDFYNIADGGKSGNPYAGKTDEEIAEIGKKKSEAGRGKHLGKNPFANKTPDEIAEIGRKRSEAISREKHYMWGKKHTNETRKKLSKAKSGKNNPNYGKLGEDNLNSKPVICISTNEVFGSAREAERKYGIQHSNICKCCMGGKKYKSAGKHPITGERLVWRYYYEQ